MGVIFSVGGPLCSRVQRNMHMNDHADSPFVLLSWSARKCICIMQLIGVMANVITVSTVHYFRLILPAQFRYEMYRVNIMQSDMSVASKRRLKFSFACLKKVFIVVVRRESGSISGLPGKTSIVGKYTQMRFRIVLHKLV